MGLTAEGSVWRLSTLGREDLPVRRAPGAARVLLPYWVIALTLAGAVQLDLLPVRSWLRLVAPPPSAADHGPSPEPFVPAPAPLPVPAPAWDSAPEDGSEPLVSPLDPAPEVPAEPAERIAALEQPPAPDPIAGLSRPAPRASLPPVRFTHTHRPRAPRLSNLDTEPSVSAPRSVSRPEPTPKPPRKRSFAAAAGSAGGGQSCEAALASYRETLDPSLPPDLSAADYAGVLNNGRYFAHCGVPSSMAVQICVAVQNGRAKGVTVRTSPPSGAKQRCVARAVWGLSYPSHPRMDVARATFR
ncbi:MAG: hypothetical protein JRI68_11550 [Deltaproteobacteria bacterium]|nr:hypothetical protein [Deltaproteobacteria bacterium]